MRLAVIPLRSRHPHICFLSTRMHAPSLIVGAARRPVSGRLTTSVLGVARVRARFFQGPRPFIRAPVAESIALASERRREPHAGSLPGRSFQVRPARLMARVRPAIGGCAVLVLCGPPTPGRRRAWRALRVSGRGARPVWPVASSEPAAARDARRAGRPALNAMRRVRVTRRRTLSLFCQLGRYRSGCASARDGVRKNFGGGGGGG